MKEMKTEKKGFLFLLDFMNNNNVFTIMALIRSVSNCFHFSLNFVFVWYDTFIHSFAFQNPNVQWRDAAE